MKKGIFWQGLKSLLCLWIFLVSVTTSIAQDKVSSYVVVGAFEFEENAKEWLQYTKAHNLNPSYRKNLNRGLYYVYVYQDDNWDNAVSKLREVWKLNAFPDAWVYTGNFGTMPVVTESPIVNENNIASAEEPEAVDDIPIITRENAQPENNPSITAPQIEEETSTEPQKTQEQLREEVIIENFQSDSLEAKENRPVSMGDYTIFFNLFNAQNLQDVKGEVQVIDAERAKLLQTVKGGEYVSIMDPNTSTGKLSLIVETFGYRKMQHEVSYKEPLADTSSLDIDIIGDILVYHFPLVRYHKGDIVTMYNVYFFKDAAIMVPESMFEVQSLLNMMKENPNYKIKIHGHTNGNNMGKIIYRGDDNEFFALTEDDEERMGSAKKLSKERSQVIKDYLVANGIDAERMEIKAWGGKRMIYDKHSNLAKKNVRVEIEILEE